MVCINGKFLSQPLTGVQRTGREMLGALDRAVARRDAGPTWRLLVPESADVPDLAAIEVVRVAGPRHLHAWEQWALPRASGSAMLVNLSGSAPAAGRHQANLLHDAAVFDCPEAYTPAFVAWYRWLFRRLARRGMLLMTVSHFSRQRLAGALGVAPETIAVIGNGADHMERIQPEHSWWRAQGFDETPYLVFVGGPQRSKNLAAVANAWRRLGRTNARLVVVGRVNSLVFQAQSLIEAPGMIVLGAVSDGGLKALLEGAKGLVFPSLYEGFGLPPLEAMYCGCPVLVSSVAALPEVCGDAALYVDPYDEAAMAAAMARLLEDGALRGDLVSRGRRQAMRWRWDDCAARLLAALQA